MDAFAVHLNEILVDTFRSILKVEEKTLKNMKGCSLTISEMHLLEAVGQGEEGQRRVSDIAQGLDITLPSVTVGINKLLKKGLVEKKRCGSDARTVYISLTKLGLKLTLAHRYFHEQMVRNITKGFSEEERQVLLKGMQNLNEFFKRQ